MFYRVLDPHGQSRGRKLSIGLRGSTNGDGLITVAEGEEEHDSDSETDTMSTVPRVRKFTYIYWVFINIYDNKIYLSTYF